MKKIIAAGLFMIGSVGMMACERSNHNDTSLEAEDNKVVVDRDSVPTEYEVTETVVEYDTTTHTKTVDADADKDHDKDRDKDRH